MKVYVETNFLLEIAYRQEQSASCEEIIALAKARSIELRIPAFCVSESISSLRNRKRERERLLQDIDKQLRECNRSVLFEPMVTNLEVVRLGLAGAMEEEATRLSDVREQIRSHAVTLPLDGEALDWSLFAQTFELFKQVPDMMVFGTIRADLERRSNRGDSDPSWFLNRNKHDFNTREVTDCLAGCSLVTSFEAALGIIKSHL